LFCERPEVAQDFSPDCGKRAARPRAIRGATRNRTAKKWRMIIVAATNFGGAFPEKSPGANLLAAQWPREGKRLRRGDQRQGG